MTKRIDHWLIVSVFVFALFWQVPDAFLRPQSKWSVMLMGLSGLIAWFMAKRIHWSVGPFVAVHLISFLHSFAWDYVGRDAAFSAVAMLTLIFFFYLLDTEHNVTLLEIAYGVCVFSSLYTLLQMLMGYGPHERYGFVGNASMNGCLIAITWPLSLEWIRRRDMLMKDRTAGIVTILAMLAIFLVKASIPILICIAMIAALAVTHRKYAIVAFIYIISWLGILHQGPEFFDSNNRWNYWQHIYSLWADSGRHWFGVGAGSGQIIFPQEMYAVQRAGSGALNGQYWSHNDFLQVLFDTGYVGIASTLLMLYYILKRSFTRPYLFTSNVGYIVCAFFNYPVHQSIHAFLGMTLGWLTHKGFRENGRHLF